MINYPNDYAYTRVTEFKYLTGQQHAKTTIVYEYATAEGDPYYPIPRPENAEVYRKYHELAAQTPDVYFAGRLATYKYYNMDQVVAQALTLFSKMAQASKEPRLSFAPAISKSSLNSAARLNGNGNRKKGRGQVLTS